MLSSYCDCDLVERTRSVKQMKLRLGTGVLVNQYNEASRHFTDCPLYAKSKAERRFCAYFSTGVWPRVPMRVRASLAYTTGAGGFSISPHLSLRIAVKDSKASNVIIMSILRAARPALDSKPLPTDDEVIETMESGQRDLQRLFRSGEASPFDQHPCGSTLLHVSYGLSECPPASNESPDLGLGVP